MILHVWYHVLNVNKGRIDLNDIACVVSMF